MIQCNIKTRLSLFKYLITKYLNKIFYQIMLHDVNLLAHSIFYSFGLAGFTGASQLFTPFVFNFRRYNLSPLST